MIDVVKKLSLNDREFEGLDIDKLNIRSKVYDSENEKPLVKPELVAGLMESGWSMDDY